MKKLIAITFCVLLLSEVVTLAKPAFGIKAGLAVSGQTFDYRDTDAEFDSRTGFQFGIFLEYPINNYFSLVPEFRYVPIGIKSRVLVMPEKGYVGESYYETFQTRLDYFSIPLMIRARLPLRHVTPYLIVGPRIDFQLGVKDGYFSELYDQFDQITAGFTFGGGVQFKLSPRYNLLVEASYSPDVTKVYETEFLNVRNHTLSIVTGVTF